MEEFGMPKNKRPSTKASSVRPRTSQHYVVNDGFEQALKRLAHERIAKAREEREKRINLEALVKQVLDEVAAMTTGLDATETVAVAGAILDELVQTGIVTGTLPSPDRVRSVIRKQLNARSAAVTTARPIASSQQSSLSSAPDRFRSSAEVPARWMDEQIQTLL
jgi:hypothetical protein